MSLISVSVDTFLVTAVCIVSGTYYILKRTQTKSQAPYSNILTVLVLLHTVYIIYVITLLYPPNLFTRLRIPITTPVGKIRSGLLAGAGLPSNASLPKPLEALLTRLSSFDIRLVYVRFGQAVIQDCEYCRTLDQYALYALPGPLLQYIREATVIGLLTVTDSHRSQWRRQGVVAVAVAFLVEAYTIASASITIPRNGKDVFMYHDTVWLLRQAFFLILPIIIHSLPTAMPLNPIIVAQHARNSVDLLSRRAALSRYLRGAVMRDPALQASAIQWWDRQKRQGQLVREAEVVQKAAEGLDRGFVEGLGRAKFLPSLRGTAKALLEVAFIPR